MASNSGPKRRSFVFLFAVLCFSVASAQAQVHSCPPPLGLETLTITHDSATLAWNKTAFERNPLHCVCLSPGSNGKVCSYGDMIPDCQANVRGRVTVQPNLDTDTSYTVCVQTQCSGVSFSSPVCRTFRTSLKDRTAQYSVVDAKRRSSSLDISWRVPRPQKGRLAGYRLRWCQSSKCVTTEKLLQGPSDQILSPKDLQPYRQYTLYASAFSVHPSSGQKLYGDETSLIVYTLETYGEEESIHLQIKAVNSSTLLVSWPEPSEDPTHLGNHIVTWWKANKIGSRPDTTHNRTIPATSTRFFIHDLEPDATYHVVLSRARNGTESSLVNIDADVYRKPDAVNAEIKRFLNDSMVLVTWDDSRFANKDTAAQLYAVKMCPTCKVKGDTQTAECKSIAVVARAGKAIFKSLRDGCQYKVEVRALVEKPDGRTELGEPAVVFFATLAALQQDEPDLYQKPEGLRTAVKMFMNASMVTVTWNVPQQLNANDSPVHQYAVRLCPTCDEKLEETESGCCSIAASASVAKAVFHGLKNFCEYRVEVRALVERVGGGIDEGEPAVTLFTTLPPNLPQLKGSLHAELHGSRVTLYWKTPQVRLAELEVFYSVRLFGPPPSSVIEATVNGSGHTFMGLEPRANYSLDVTVCVSRSKRQHCGANTTLEFQALPSGLSGNVGDLNVKAAGPTELKVSWSSPIQDNDVTCYQVSLWRDETEGAGESELRNFTAPRNETTMIIDGLEAYTSYTVQVVAVYERRNVKWLGSPQNASATTHPERPPHVTNISITTTNRTQFSSDVLISWTTINATAKSLVHTKYYIMMCLGADDVTENCRNQTVSGEDTTLLVSGVKHYAAVFVAVQPFLKVSGSLIEGQISAARGTTWTPPIPSVRGLTVQDITGNSARVSWSEVKELSGIDGVYYGVVLSMHSEGIDEDIAPGERVVLPNVTSPEKSLNGTPTAPEKLIVLHATTRVAETELHGLKPWNNYTVVVYPAVAGSGLVVAGNASSEVFETPAEAPGKPRNVSVVERQGNHYLTWLPPESWNGPRSGYEVTITCMSGNVRANSTSVAIKADKVELKIPRLSPGVPCSMGIHAYNVYQGEPMDGAKVRVKFTPPKMEGAIATERTPTF
ncbi:tenascin-N-like [Amblyomma americanum]